MITLSFVPFVTFVSFIFVSFFSFVTRFARCRRSVDTLITVNNYQRHAVMKDKGPLNFDPDAKGDKTQDLAPVSVAVYSILAWQYKPFKQTYEQSGGFGYFNGKIEYYEVSTLSGIVIKYKRDMDLAETILLQRGECIPPPPGGYPEYHEVRVCESRSESDELRKLVHAIGLCIAGATRRCRPFRCRSAAVLNATNISSSPTCFAHCSSPTSSLTDQTRKEERAKVFPLRTGSSLLC